MSNTSIALSKGTKGELDGLKKADNESYESVVLRLIEDYNESEHTLSDTQKAEVRDIIRTEVVVEALE